MPKPPIPAGWREVTRDEFEATLHHLDVHPSPSGYLGGYRRNMWCLHSGFAVGMSLHKPIPTPDVFLLPVKQ